MDIKTAREKIEDLELKIETLIKEFEETTGLTIEDLHLERSDFSSHEKPDYNPLQYILTKVTL